MLLIKAHFTGDLQLERGSLEIMDKIDDMEYQLITLLICVKVKYDNISGSDGA